MRVSLMMMQMILLVVLQLVSLAVLWTSSPLTQAATSTFALYLSVDLVSFAIMSYAYRSIRNGGTPSQAWILVGSLSLLLLLVSNLVLE